jgi:hypothetical protein
MRRKAGHALFLLLVIIKPVAPIQGKNKLFYKRRSCYQDLPKIPAAAARFQG